MGHSTKRERKISGESFLRKEMQTNFKIEIQKPTSRLKMEKAEINPTIAKTAIKNNEILELRREKTLGSSLRKDQKERSRSLEK